MTDIKTEPALGDRLARLTKVQQDRMLAFLGGESQKSIARRENVSAQAVSQTLASPPVRAVFVSVAGHRLSGANESVEELITRLLGVLQEAAFGAKRPVIYGNQVIMVPDHRLRVEAALKLLQFVEPVKPSADLSRNDTVVAKETVTREVRRTRRH